jgi:hypothetical protein
LISISTADGTLGSSNDRELAARKWPPTFDRKLDQAIDVARIDEQLGKPTAASLIATDAEEGLCRDIQVKDARLAIDDQDARAQAIEDSAGVRHRIQLQPV